MTYFKRITLFFESHAYSTLSWENWATFDTSLNQAKCCYSCILKHDRPAHEDSVTVAGPRGAACCHVSRGQLRNAGGLSLECGGEGV